jgi:hypothetical protein
MLFNAAIRTVIVENNYKQGRYICKAKKDKPPLPVFLPIVSEVLYNEIQPRCLGIFLFYINL